MSSKRQTMCPPGYLQSASGLIVTYPLGHKRTSYAQDHELVWGHWWMVDGNKREGKSFWLHIYYADFTSLGFEYSNMCVYMLYIYIYTI